MVTFAVEGPAFARGGVVTGFKESIHKQNGSAELERPSFMSLIKKEQLYNEMIP